MNQKIQSLIDGGFITIQDVMSYATDYNDKCIVESLEEQYDYYYENEYNNNAPEWESNDPDAPDYEDTQDVEWPTNERCSDPEYIIASTSYSMEETYVFEANEDGEITNFGEYGGLAKRWGDLNWTNYYTAVDNIFGEGKYKFERRVPGIITVARFLFKRIDNK